MAIVKMNRFTLLTFEQYKRPLLKALQAFENVHFRRLQAEDFGEIDTIKRNVENAAAYENELAHVVYAADRLKPFADLPTGLKAMTAAPAEMSFDELDRYTADYDYKTVCDDVRRRDERLKTIQTELTKLQTENDNLRLWSAMDVAPSEIDRLKTVRYMIGSVNKNAAQGFLVHMESAFKNVYVEMLHTVKDDTVFFVTAQAADWENVSAELKNAGFTRTLLSFTGIPSDKIRENEKSVNALKAEADKLTGELKTFAAHYTRLSITADYFRTALERAKACENFMNLSDVLIVEGWFPTDQAPRFKQILETACMGDYYLEETAVEPESTDVPIALKNNKIVSAFEDVTAMFSLPRYNEIDPTPVLMPFYWLFFGIMVGDIGYGLLLVIATAAALKFLNFKPGMRRFLKFFHILGYAVILAGVLYGGAFGVTVFAPLTGPNGAPKAILDSQLDITTMLIISIAIGVFQVLFGLGVKGYMLIRDGKPLAAIFDSLFWIVALVSAIGWLLAAIGVIPSSLVPVGQWGLVGSLIGLAATQGRESPTIVGKVASGLYAVYGITGYVGDFVSYTRLVALALSGAYIAFSFNMMAGLIPNTLVRFIAGGLIVVIGQSINLGLALLGAYVHTCRLQYVEFFGKFYEGGGVPFKPLTPKNIFINLKSK